MSFGFTSCSIHNSGKMDGRKHWGAYDDDTEMGNYNEMDNFHFYNESDNYEFSRTTNDRHSAPLGSGSGRYNNDSGRYNDDSGRYNDDSGRYNDDSGRYNNDSGRYNNDSGRYNNDSGRYNNDASFQRFPQETPGCSGRDASFQRFPQETPGSGGRDVSFQRFPQETPGSGGRDVSVQRFPQETPGCGGRNNRNTAEEVCCCPAHEGRMCATLAAALPGLIGGVAGQSGLMMKPFLPFPIDNTAAPLAMPPIFPNFNTMDPVQKAVIKHTFGGVAKARQRKQPIKCSVCQLRFNSNSQAQAHYRGTRHAKKLKMQQKNDNNKLSIKKRANDTGAIPPTAPSINRNTEVGSQASLGSKPSSAPASPPLPQETPPTSEWETEQAKKLLYCSLCKVSVNSLMQLHAHNSGTKHKTMLDARSSSGSIKAFPRAGVKVKSSPGAPASTPLKGSGLQNKTFQCQTCNVHVNSEIQLKQHISSRRHKDRVAGKPTKPKFNKSQRMEVTRPPLSASFVPSSSTFLRPAPGPIRVSQGSSMLFSPY
ncbi:zinc finger protein 385D-like isoform X1 [Phyllopteryx taeniolatus]|uniref:zinc finger protein 385D-like isoform X1 n=1 Tax=Phyllopteryx taeniolatus TaxID=161469 RepID=UPI002AD34C2A|nr:zinc finger protein 385D-like isoform X1 [Phyllopteryx taeniolatus]